MAQSSLDVIPIRKKALITGITGQDGSYLAEFLLSKGYEVHGIIRRSSSFNTGRINHLYRDRHETGVAFFLHFGDMTDSTTLMTIISSVRPDEIYNLAAMSHVKVSFEMPEYTAQVDGIGTLRLLDAMRASGLATTTRFYQASTSELFGSSAERPQKETTAFHPRSPYGMFVLLLILTGCAGIAKLFAYWSVVNYREAYGMHVTNGILFNHESPRRGPTFVTRKVTRAVARVHRGLQKCLYLGNLDAKRDWGHAKDYVEGMWLMLQQPTSDDYILATGECHSVREFVQMAFQIIGIQIDWVGVRGSVNEVGYDVTDRDRVLVRVDAMYFRPTEVDELIGDCTKAKNRLGWEPKVSFNEMVREMVLGDIVLVDSGSCED